MEVGLGRVSWIDVALGVFVDCFDLHLEGARVLGSER
jgi:hypothetical protein